MIMSVILDESVLFLAKSKEIFKPPQPSQEHVPELMFHENGL